MGSEDKFNSSSPADVYTLFCMLQRTHINSLQNKGLVVFPASGSRLSLAMKEINSVYHLSRNGFPHSRPKSYDSYETSASTGKTNFKISLNTFSPLIRQLLNAILSIFKSPVKNWRHNRKLQKLQNVENRSDDSSGGPEPGSENVKVERESAVLQMILYCNLQSPIPMLA